MIRIDKPEPGDQAWKDWRDAATAERWRMHRAFARGEVPKIKEALYKAQKQALLDLFNGKCAFCETYIPSAMHGDIEHFRPKGGVLEEDGKNATYLDKNGIVRDHPGYYWLAYDWRNLLPSCQLCNQPSAGGGGKRNYFPLKKPADGSKPIRAHRPKQVVKEEPAFVHPWFENPAEHFAFDETGVIIALTERAEECVKRLTLDREGLMTARRDAYDIAREKYNAYMGKATEDVESLKKLKAELREFQEGKRPYSAPARVAIAEERANRLQRDQELDSPDAP